MGTPIRIRRVGFRHVLAPAGRFGAAEAAAVLDAFLRAAEQGAQELWLNLSLVTTVDGRALDAVARIAAFGRELERRTLVICPPGPVRKALAQAGIDDDVEIHDSVTAAQRAG